MGKATKTTNPGKTITGTDAKVRYPVPPQVEFGGEAFKTARDLKEIGDALIRTHAELESLRKAKIAYLWKRSGGSKRGKLQKSEGQPDERTEHGTQKPVECMARPMRHHGKAGDIVYDPFAGSGTCFIAAELASRRCVGIELDPGYCDLAVRRWESFTGEKAIHDETGRTFAEAAKPAKPGRRRAATRKGAGKKR